MIKKPEKGKAGVSRSVKNTGSRQVEIKLRESMEYFRTVANFTYDWEYWLDDNRRILYTSPSCERITGHSAAEFEEDPSLLEKIIHPDDLPLYQHHIREEFQKTEPVSLDFRILTASGEVRWISHACQRVSGKNGRPMGRRASNRDITERRQMEQALRENESILSMSEEVAHTGSWRWDLRTKKAVWSDQMFQLFEVKREDFDGDMNRVIVERVHPDDATAVLDFNRSILTGISSVATITYRIVLPGGGERTVRAQGKLVYDDAGQPISMAGYVREVTEWVKVKNELLQSTRLHDILSQVNKTIARVKDSEGLYPSICDAAAKHGQLAAAWVEILDEASGELRPVAASGLDPKKWLLPVVNKDSPQEGLALEAFRASRVVTSGDAQTDERTKSLRKLDFHSLVSIPLELQGKTIGVLNLASGDAGLFTTEEEISLLEEMGLDISSALDRLEGEKNRHRWMDALERCAYGAAICLPTGRIVTCNPAFARSQGYSVEEISSMSILDMYHPSQREFVEQCIAKADGTGRIQYEAWMIRKNGSVYPIQMDLVSVRNENGDLLYRIVNQQDEQAEEALRESREKIRSIFRAAPTGIGVVRDRVLVEVNDRICEMTGYLREELIGQSARVLYPTQEDFDFVGREKYRQIAEKGTGQVETCWRKRDGSIIDVLLASTPIDVTDHSKGVTFTALDITERKQAEKALRESEERFHMFFDKAPLGYQSLDADGRFIDVNQAWLDTMGYSHEEVLGHWFGEFLSPEYVDAFRERFPLFKAAGQIHSEFEMLHKNGSKHWIAFDGRIGYELNGEFKQTHCILQDVTDRKQAEEALRESEDKFRKAFMTSPDSININRLQDGMYISINPGFTQIMGYTEADVIGKTSFELHIWENPQDRARLVEGLKKDGFVNNLEACFRRKDGGTKYGLMSAAVIELGGIPHILSITRDITDRKRTEEAIRQSERQMRALLTSLDDIVFEFDEEGGYLNIWAADESLLAMPKIQMLGKHATEVMGEKHGSQFENAIKRSLAENTPQSIEYPLEVIGGKRWFMARVSPILSADGTSRTASVLVRDITERKRIEEQVQVQLQRVRALNEIDRAISSSLDMRLSLDILLTHTLNQLEVDAACVLLLNPSSQTLEYLTGRGFRSTAIRDSRIMLGRGFPGRAGLERKTLYVPDIKTDEDKFIRKKVLIEEGFVEYACVPLIAKGLLKGVLEIFNRTHLKPDMEWMNYLETLGGQAAIAIDNAQLFEGMQRSNMDLIAAYDATIEGWSHAMDLRDKETEGHTVRVTDWTVKLAKAMGVSQQEITHMRRGALLHDIGKLGVPDHILHKPEGLDQLEWEIMRQHPAYAFDMLLPIAYLRPALDIPYCHHEKWDGTGYPRGLKGEEIPLAARIFAVVDVWDALRSDRPYRKGWTIEKICKHLMAESGRHFDPRVVDAFLQILEDEQ